MSQIVIHYVDTDELPILSFEYEDQDLSVFASIVLRIRRPDGRLIEKAAVIDDAPGGLFHFEFAVGDLIFGHNRAEVRFTDLSGKSETFPAEAPIAIIVRGEV